MLPEAKYTGVVSEVTAPPLWGADCEVKVLPLMFRASILRSQPTIRHSYAHVTDTEDATAATRLLQKHGDLCCSP